MVKLLKKCFGFFFFKFRYFLDFYFWKKFWDLCMYMFVIIFNCNYDNEEK